MTLIDHKRWVRTGINFACLMLGVAVVAQLVFHLDFDGLPFLAFGVIVGVLGASLLVRKLCERIEVQRD